MQKNLKASPPVAPHTTKPNLNINSASKQNLASLTTCTAAAGDVQEVRTKLSRPSMTDSMEAKAAAKERTRIDTIRGMIAGIKVWPIKCLGWTSEKIRAEILSSQMDIPCGPDDDYEEFTAEAEAERIIALSTMTNMAEAAEKSEAEAKRLDDQREQDFQLSGRRSRQLWTLLPPGYAKGKGRPRGRA